MKKNEAKNIYREQLADFMIWFWNDCKENESTKNTKNNFGDVDGTTQMMLMMIKKSH